jgi:hypothetical protein
MYISLRQSQIQNSIHLGLDTRQHIPRRLDRLPPDRSGPICATTTVRAEEGELYQTGYTINLLARSMHKQKRHRPVGSFYALPQ